MLTPARTPRPDPSYPLSSELSSPTMGVMLYPLRFQPLFRDYLWGGRRLATELGKKLPDPGIFAESWEVVDRGPLQSRVLAGQLAGTELGSLVHDHGRQLFGRHYPQTCFPWLFKFLDAHRALSVQVHPNDHQASQRIPPDRGKTEAWVVMAVEQGSFLFAGLKQGVDAIAFRQALTAGNVEDLLHRIDPQPGDCIFLPAGTVHALGAGLLVAEIQQSSDTTFRVFDWNRVGPDGRTRELHIEEAMAVIDFQSGPVEVTHPRPPDQDGTETLVCCDKFILRRMHVAKNFVTPHTNELSLLAVIDGEIAVDGDPVAQPLTVGETVLVPASCAGVTIQTGRKSTLLQVTLP